jgi:hypothetical protein
LASKKYGILGINIPRPSNKIARVPIGPFLMDYYKNFWAKNSFWRLGIISKKKLVSKKYSVLGHKNTCPSNKIARVPLIRPSFDGLLQKLLGLKFILESGLNWYWKIDI